MLQMILLGLLSQIINNQFLMNTIDKSFIHLTHRMDKKWLD